MYSEIHHYNNLLEKSHVDLETTKAATCKKGKYPLNIFYLTNVSN